MNFPFYFKTENVEDIELEDIGNCCLNAINDDALEWYMLIRTELGQTVVKQFGPLTVDINGIYGGFSYNEAHIEFNEKKLHKIINEFLNNPKKMITQAMEVEPEVAAARFEDANVFII